MRYIKEVKEHGVVVADTDTDSLILYSNAYRDKDKGITEIRPTNMLTEDIAGYFPSKTLRGKKNTYAVIHPNDLIKNVKQYMVFPDDSNWLINLILDGKGETDDKDSVLSKKLTDALSRQSSVVTFDSSELGLFAVRSVSGDSVAVFIKLMTSAGDIRMFSISFVIEGVIESGEFFKEDDSDCNVAFELIDGAFIIKLISSYSEVNIASLKRNGVSSIIVKDLVATAEFQFNYVESMDIIDIVYPTKNNSTIDLKLNDYIFDKCSNAYYRPFDECNTQCAVPLRFLNEPNIKTIDNGGLFNYDYNGGNENVFVHSHIVYGSNAIGLLFGDVVDASTIKSIDNRIKFCGMYRTEKISDLYSYIPRFLLLGENTMEDTVACGGGFVDAKPEYSLSDAEKFFPHDFIALNSGFNLRDYGHLITKLRTLLSDTSFIKMMKLKVQFLGIPFEYENLLALRVPVPKIFLDILDINRSCVDYITGRTYDYKTEITNLSMCFVNTSADNPSMLPSFRAYFSNSVPKDSVLLLNCGYAYALSYCFTRGDKPISDTEIRKNGNSYRFNDYFFDEVLQGSFVDFVGTNKSVGETISSMLDFALRH